jgi:hypothetical protein
MEIEENVNPGIGKRQFSKIPFENRQNMQSQIVVCHSRHIVLGRPWEFQYAAGAFT